MKTIKLAVFPFSLVAAAVLFGGCGGDGSPDDPSPGGKVVSSGDAGSEVAVSSSSDTPDSMTTTFLSASSQSWQKSCDAANWYFDRNGYWYRLDAHCRTRSGSFRWSTYNDPPSCGGDLANCDGSLHCGRC